MKMMHAQSCAGHDESDVLPWAVKFNDLPKGEFTNGEFFSLTNPTGVLPSLGSALAANVSGYQLPYLYHDFKFEACEESGGL